MAGPGAPGASAAPSSTAEEAWIADGPVHAVALSGDTLYLGGFFNFVGAPTGAFAKLDATTGEADLAAPVVRRPSTGNATVSASAPDGAGGWYVGGIFTEAGGVARTNLVHILADGTVDPTFAPNPNGVVDALALDGSTLYVGGSFTSIGGQGRSNLAAVDATTGAASAWNPGVVGSVDALATDGDTIYAGGNFSSVDGQSRLDLAAIDATSGDPLTGWTPNPNGDVAALLLDGGTLFVGGDFTQIAGQSRASIASLDAATGAANSWNPNITGTSDVQALALSGTTLYFGGDFPTVGGQPRVDVAAVNKSTATVAAWDASTGGPGGTEVSALAVEGSTVYLGGRFDSIDGQPRLNLAAVDATTGDPSTWNPGAGSQVRTIGTGGGSVYVGGSFFSAQGVERQGLAAIDLTTGKATSWDPSNLDANVRAIVVDGSTIYVGGSFLEMGGETRQGIAALDTSSGLATAWNPDIDAFPNPVLAIALSDDTVYVGGIFAERLAAIDAATGTVDPLWDPAPDNTVTSLAVDGNTVYVGGDFANIGGQARSRIAALSASTGLATGWNPGAGGGVDAIAVDGGLVYVAGSFATAGGQSRDDVAAIDATTGAASAWDPNLDGSLNAGGVAAVAVEDDTVYIGGGFDDVDGVERLAAAAVDATSGDATAWNPAIGDDSDSVVSLAVEGSTVALGGDQFSRVGGDLRLNLAVFKGPQHALSVLLAGTGAGDVTSSPTGIDCPDVDCTHDFEEDTQVTLTPAAAPNSAFAGWSGACTGTGACVVTMDQARSVTATFDLVPSFTLDVTLAGSGSGTVTSDPANIDCEPDCSADFAENTDVELTAVASSGSVFTGWSGDCTGTSTCDLTMDEDKDVTATFDLIPIFEPDAQIKTKKATTFTGDDVINTDGTDQTLQQKKPRGKKAVFNLRLENDGDTSDTFGITGCVPVKGFKVSYLKADGTDVTQLVATGDYDTASLAPGSTAELTVVIKIKSKGKSKMTCLVTATSNGDGTSADVVGAAVKVKR